MDIREIQNLIKFVAKSGATEVKLEMDDFKITIKTTEAGAAEASYFQHYPAAQPMQQMMPQHQMPQPVAPVTPVAAPAVDDNSKYITIKSPMIGTLYRKPAPDKAPFVEVGATISKGDPVCVIEAMKLFNEIESEVSGKIIKILVDDM